MKLRERIVWRIASMLRVHVSPENKVLTIPEKKRPRIVLTNEKDIKLWNELSSQLKEKRRYILLTEDEDIEHWELSKTDIRSDKECSPLSMIAYKNLIHSLYRMLDDAKILSIPAEKKSIIQDIEKAFSKCGLEIVRYDGSNIELFELKEDLEIEEIRMGSNGIRDKKTGEMLITGVLFVPYKN